MLAFFVGVTGVAAGSTRGIDTDIGLAMLSIVGIAGLLLAAVALSTHIEPRFMSPI